MANVSGNPVMKGLPFPSVDGQFPEAPSESENAAVPGRREDAVGEPSERRIGVVQFELCELIDLDSDAIHEQMSRRLVGHDRLVDLDYTVVGHGRDTLYVEVSGDEEPMSEPSPEDLLERPAAEVLGIETLDVRASDDLDFHELGVRSIKRALETAFEAGRLCGEER
jgi:hypothetical protein